MRYLALAALLALAACAPLTPTPPETPAARATAGAEEAAGEGPMCSGLDEALCDEVLAAAIGQLAWLSRSFTGPGTIVEAACPDALPNYFVDHTPCWIVTLPLSTGMTPQVVMARRDDGVIAQLGGDSISGSVTRPGDDAGGAPGDCLAPAEDYGTVVAAFRSTVGAIRQLGAVADNPQLAEYADDQKATVCYVDGRVAKSPPPPLSGTPPPSFDRAVLVVVRDVAYFMAAGYQAKLPIEAP